MPSSKLAICIPTYKRPAILAKSLELLIPIVRPHEIPVYIQDDCSNDGTNEVVGKAQETYQHLHYRSLPQNVGYDRSFSSVLRWATTDYRWLLGDYCSINAGWIDRLYQKMNERKYDLIVVNGYSRIKSIPSKDYEDPVDLLRDLGWHMSWLSCIVWSRNIIDAAPFERYLDTDFAHTGAIFENLAKRKIQVRWEADEAIFIIPQDRGSFYKKRIIEVLIRKWADVILSLPASYPLKVKFQVIREHALFCKMADLAFFMRMRSQGLFDSKILKECSPHLQIVLGRKTAAVEVIAHMNPYLVRLLLAIRRIVGFVLKGPSRAYHQVKNRVIAR